MLDPSRPVVVIGQGYVGLPLSMRAVDVGYSVVGLDVDHNRIEALQNGRSFVEDVPDSKVRAALDSGRYRASSDYAAATDFGVAVITVPTPLKETLPDLSFIQDSARTLAPFLSKGATVVLESTTYPGTTEELLVPILERATGLTAGEDFFVGYSPERIDPGNTRWNFVNTPKVVSGINRASLERVDAFYSSLVERTVPVSSPKEAELTKLLENTFRHVNIALVNELAVFADELGVDVWESIDAASTKPFGFMKFTPGPGVGGHCLPVDPSYLSWQVKRTLGKNFRFVELANEVNENMPAYVVQRAIELLNTKRRSLNGSKVLVAGIAYKKNSGDSRESPALRIVDLLENFGAEVLAADPFVVDARWPKNVRRRELTAETVAEADLVILVTDHDVFDFSMIEKFATSGDTLVFDTRNRLSAEGIHRL